MDLATDIEQEVLELSRYGTDPLSVFQTILTKVYRFNHERLSYYGVDYKQQDVRDNAGLIYVSFWESLDHLMHEVKASVEKPLQKLFNHIDTFIQHLRDRKQKSDRTEFVANWIHGCTAYHTETVEATTKEREKFRKLFIKESVFSDFRMIREAHLIGRHTDNLVDEMGAIFDKQLQDLLDIIDRPGQTTYSDDVIKLIRNKKKYVPKDLANYKRRLKQTTEQGKRYDVYREFVTHLNTDGRMVFNIVRRVSILSLYRLDVPLSFHYYFDEAD